MNQSIHRSAGVASLERPHSRLMLAYVLRVLPMCLLGPWFLIALVPLYFRYHTLRYRFDHEGISVSWGVLWRRETHLTYARIQDIHVSRGLFERWLGLATIHVQTAAGNAGAEMMLEGLSDYQAVRDFLYDRMRGAKLDHELPPAAAQDDPVVLLTAIRDELRAIRTRLGAR